MHLLVTGLLNLRYFPGICLDTLWKYTTNVSEDMIQAQSFIRLSRWAKQHTTTCSAKMSKCVCNDKVCSPLHIIIHTTYACHTNNMITFLINVCASASLVTVVSSIVRTFRCGGNQIVSHQHLPIWCICLFTGCHKSHFPLGEDSGICFACQ